ncbi:hypothetical protein HK096_005907, partial [Nowakowskiella sp. JEL0078]
MAITVVEARDVVVVKVGYARLGVAGGKRGSEHVSEVRLCRKEAWLAAGYTAVAGGAGGRGVCANSRRCVQPHAAGIRASLSFPLTPSVLQDRAASFGPGIPNSGSLVCISGFAFLILLSVIAGIRGALLNIGALSPSNDIHGCQKFSPPLQPRSWIALVVRGNCSFIDKVRAMQASGATAVVVANNLPNSALITMYAPGETSDIQISSVFISQHSYFELLALFVERPKLIVDLYSEEGEVPLVEIIIVTIVSPTLVMLLLYVFWSFAQAYQRQQEIAPMRAVKKLPKKIFDSSKVKENDPTECIICLDDFVDGIEVRVLPCRHEFHIPCIDKWLLHRKRTCPICKQETCPPNQRTPLLLALRTISAVTRGSRTTTNLERALEEQENEESHNAANESYPQYGTMSQTSHPTPENSPFSLSSGSSIGIGGSSTSVFVPRSISSDTVSKLSSSIITNDHATVFDSASLMQTSVEASVLPQIEIAIVAPFGVHDELLTNKINNSPPTLLN